MALEPDPDASPTMAGLREDARSMDASSIDAAVEQRGARRESARRTRAISRSAWPSCKSTYASMSLTIIAWAAILSVWTGRR